MDHPLRSTLLAEGTSDRALLPIIALALAANVHNGVQIEETRLVDHARLPLRIKRDRGAWVRSAVDEYPCDVLFVHRDADAAGRPKRLEEIGDWLAQASIPPDAGIGVVALVPVRMTEAWLLVEESSIRAAASNPCGTSPLELPSLNTLERLADPKSNLATALKIASGLPPGRLKRSFDVNKARGRIAVANLANLRRLQSFIAFEKDVADTCLTRGWSESSRP